MRCLGEKMRAMLVRVWRFDMLQLIVLTALLVAGIYSCSRGWSNGEVIGVWWEYPSIIVGTVIAILSIIVIIIRLLSLGVFAWFIA